MGRIDLGDPALHPVLVGEAVRPLAAVVSSSFRQTSSKGAPAFISIWPAASHWRRSRCP